MPDGQIHITVPDKKTNRPKTIAEKRSLVRLVYRWNEWDKHCHQANCQMLDMPIKRIDDYSAAELDVFLTDFEKHRMLIFLD